MKNKNIGVRKSDEMVEDLMSGVVSGAVRIYQTMKDEHHESLQYAQDRISDLSREIESLKETITAIKGENGRQRIENIDLTQALRKEKERSEQYKDYWLKVANDKDVLEKRIEEMNRMFEAEEIQQNLKGTEVHVC